MGTLSCPYATITYAQSVAPAGSTIVILAGTWAENFTYVNGLTYDGSLSSPTSMTGTVLSGGGSAVFNQISFINPIVWNITVSGSQISFTDSRPSAITVTGQAANCRIVLSKSSPAGAVTLTDCGIITRGTTILNPISYVMTGAFVVQSSARSTFETGTTVASTVFISSNSSGANLAADLFIYNSAITGVLTLNGQYALVTSTPGGFDPTTLVQQNSAPYPVLINGAPTLSYAPTTPANWLVVPSNGQQGLDYLASRAAAAFSAAFTLSGQGTVSATTGRQSVGMGALGQAVDPNPTGTTGAYWFRMPHACTASNLYVALQISSGVPTSGVSYFNLWKATPSFDATPASVGWPGNNFLRGSMTVNVTYGSSNNVFSAHDTIHTDSFLGGDYWALQMDNVALSVTPAVTLAAGFQCQ